MSFKKIIRYILLIGVISLIYRLGNFYNTFIPKPFEIILAVTSLLTITFIVWENKIRDFFLIIPKNIWWAIFLMYISIIFGWVISFFNGFPLTLNSILEFGTFSVSWVSFILVIFYTNNDNGWSKKYFYALLLPSVYVITLLFAGTKDHLLFDSVGKLIGLTTNPNIISKTLLIPGLFFVTLTFFEKIYWRRIFYFLISSALLALLFWISSRGALLSFFLGVMLVYIIFIFHNFQWKKFFISSLILTSIFYLGFFMTPGERKVVVLERIFTSDTKSAPLVVIVKTEESKEGLESDFEGFNSTSTFLTGQSIKNNKIGIIPTETRLMIWPFFIKYMVSNPLGVGPNTHIPSNIIGADGYVVSSGPHNTFLQICLWGGLAALFALIYIIFIAYQKLLNKLKFDFSPINLAMIGILSSLTFAIMFDDSLSFFWYWIILALSLRDQSS